MEPFAIQDCALLTRMSGLSAAVNLRELRDRIAVCSENVIYHHFCGTLLRPSFDYPDYHNDFAIWAKLHLGDPVLAERLGILDPYSFPSLEVLRSAVLDRLEERLEELPVVPTASPGAEFFFQEAITVVFDTGERVGEPAELVAAIRRMTTGSLYFHFFEARRRIPFGRDDFSAWLDQFGEAGVPCREALGSIDYNLFTLTELKKELVRRLGSKEAT